MATRFFLLATEKKFSVATWRLYKKVNFGPCDTIFFGISDLLLTSCRVHGTRLACFALFFTHDHESVGKGKELGDRCHSSKMMVYTHITLTVDTVGKNLGPIADFK